MRSIEMQCAGRAVAFYDSLIMLICVEILYTNLHVLHG